MDIQRIIKAVDHTELKVNAVWQDIELLCNDALTFNTASVCIPPSFVKRAADYLGGRLPVCTVVGFPNGYSVLAAKLTETEEALKYGASEIDMVINVADLKEKNYRKILTEIESIKGLCGDHILKVIIETCLLSDPEKIKMCQLVTEAKADYIKTSTGFSTGGATFKDVKLMAENVGPTVKIKAAGGISSLEDAEQFMNLGASRLGTSRIIKILKSDPNLFERFTN